MSASRPTQRGIGLPATLGFEIARQSAAVTQSAGYHSFWLNNPPGAHALQSLGRIAPEVSALLLGVGVIPLSDHPPESIVRDVQADNVPVERLYLGLGSGSGGGGVERVAQGVEPIRSQLNTSIVVAAMGPRMCRLAGEQADGVLFNWLTPAYAHRAVEWVEAGAQRAGRSTPRLMAYVRVTMGDQGKARLREEARRYEAIPHYAAHFERMGTRAYDTAIATDSPDELQTGLAAWAGIVDEIVLRVIPAADSVADIKQIIEAARPGM